jgi:hypothetical protein
VQTDAVDCRSSVRSSRWQLKSMAKRFVETLDSATIAFEGVRQQRQSRAQRAHGKCRRSRGRSKETSWSALFPTWSPLGTCLLSSLAAESLICIADPNSSDLWLLLRFWFELRTWYLKHCHQKCDGATTQLGRHSRSGWSGLGAGFGGAPGCDTLSHHLQSSGCRNKSKCGPLRSCGQSSQRSLS